MIGTASTAPTAPLTSRESLNRKARRERLALRTLSGCVLAVCVSCVFCSIVSIAFTPAISRRCESKMVSRSYGIRLARITRALRCKPRNDVGDLLIRHRLRSISAPIPHALIRPPRNRNAAQVLIADQRKIRPINDGTNFSRIALCITSGSFACSSMASRAEDAESLLPTSAITRQRGPVLRNTQHSEKVLFAPLLHHPMRQHTDLLIGQHTTGTPGEGRHQLARHSLCSNLAQILFS